MKAQRMQRYEKSDNSIETIEYFKMTPNDSIEK